MAFQATPTDVSIIISVASANSGSSNNNSNNNDASSSSFASERRITPSWTVFQLKGKLETMTGIPPGSQKLRLKAPGREDQWVEGDDRVIGDWGLMRGCEIEVSTGKSLIKSRTYTLKCMVCFGM